jgi:hypothetical protein
MLVMVDNIWHNKRVKNKQILLAKKRLPCLTPVILFMAGSGFHRSKVIALNWGAVAVLSGLVRVKQCKGGKARSAVI